MNDINKLLEKLQETSSMHHKLQGVFSDFPVKIEDFIANIDSREYKIEGIEFTESDDKGFIVLFINREYKLAFSSVKHDDVFKGKINFYRILPNELKEIDCITCDDSGWIKDFGESGLDLRKEVDCANLLFYWLNKEINS
jgi:hypothetical protein